MMRKYQINVAMQMVDEDGQLKEFTVYSDSNNIWETLCAAFGKTIDILRQEHNFPLPSFGCSEYYPDPIKVVMRPSVDGGD